MSSRTRDERGMVLPTRLLALCISAVAVATLVFIANDPDKAPDEVATPSTSKPSATPTTKATTTTKAAKPVHKAKPIKRGDVLVEVFNNTRTKGLAGGVAAKARTAGWNVVGQDNWYGSIDGSSVYYPPRLKAAAKALARDLGIKKLRPAEDPMHFDRVTVILTDDYR
jgi:hypothetical protein